jgi:hypothetical protein
MLGTFWGWFEFYFNLVWGGAWWVVGINGWMDGFGNG